MRVLLGVARLKKGLVSSVKFVSREGETRLAKMSTPRGRAGGELKQRRNSAPSGSRARSVRKPDDIVRDVRGLKLRQRVSVVLNDKGLRDELEDIMVNFRHNGPKSNADGFRTYQDFLIPSSAFYGPGLASTIHPISDIRGSDSLNYSKQERLLRCKLASVYRLTELFKWTCGIYGHITARATTGEDHYLINPFGLLYSEVTASSLVKVDKDGNVIDGGSTCLGVNKAGLVIHSTIHCARKNVKCVIHLHQQAATAVSMMRQGLMPLSIEALTLGEISYHDFQGITVDEAEKTSLEDDFKENSKVIILRNHGIVVVGETIEEAFHIAENAVRACEFQVRAMAAGEENLIKCDEQVQQQVAKVSAEGVDTSGSKWKTGELEFEAYMRMLDSMGYKTGYVYKNPEVFQGEQKGDRAATTPATVTSTRSRTPYYTPEIERGPVRRAHSTGRANTYRNRLKWLNSPVKSTEYKKEKEKAEIDEDYEPAIIKDLQPEKEDKDQEILNKPEVAEDVVLPTTKVTDVESAPFDPGFFNGDADVAAKSDGEVDGRAGVPGDEGTIELKAELGVPGEDGTSPRKKRGTKVKKNPSFKDKIVKRFSRKAERPKSEKVEQGETANDKAD